MKNYIVYNSDGKILVTGCCAETDFLLQAQDGEFVMEGVANDVTQKVEFDGLDEENQPINPRVVDKTPAEIERDNPTPVPIPFEKKPALITNEQWENMQNRIAELESKI